MRPRRCWLEGSDYPAVLRDRLGDAVPASLHALGDTAIRPLAGIASFAVRLAWPKPTMMFRFARAEPTPS